MISMKKITSNQTADFVAIALANLFNLIMVVIFVLCTMQAGHLLFVGIIWVVFIVALASTVFLNIKIKRGRWFIVFPLLFGIFLVVEVVLDYIAKYFRSTIDGLVANIIDIDAKATSSS